MKSITSHLVLIALLLVAGGLAPIARAVEDRAIGVDSDDREMNAAIKQARAKLPHFWEVHKSPKKGESDFCLKVKVTDGDRVEHFWCTDVEVKNGVTTAVIGNDAEVVRNVKLGQKIKVKDADITDWMYLKGGKMIGNYTVRPLMKSMSKDELEFLKANLGELPKD